MGVIAKDDRKIILYYNSETSLGKKTLAYITTSEKRIITIDISKTKVTGTQWTEIADNLNIGISELIDTEHPNFIKNYGSHKIDIDSEDWLKLLDKSPELLVHPIIINGGQVLQLKNPTDIKKLTEF